MVTLCMETNAKYEGDNWERLAKDMTFKQIWNIAMQANVINSLFKITQNTKAHNEVKIKFDSTQKESSFMEQWL